MKVGLESESADSRRPTGEVEGSSTKTEPTVPGGPSPGMVRLAIGALVVITVLAFGVRLWNLDREPMHVDEIKQALEVQSPWRDLPELSYRHQQPPLDYFLGKSAVVLGGTSDRSQRMPSLIAGVVVVAQAGWLLIRRRYPVAGVAVALLAAVHPFLVSYSQYARPYSLPIACVLAVLVAYDEIERRGRSRWSTLLFVLVASLALLSRALMPAIALGVFVLVRLAFALKRPAPLRDAIRTDPLALIALPLTFVFVWFPSFLVLRHFSGHLVEGRYDLFGRLATSLERFGEFGGRAVHPWPLLLSLLLVLLVLLWRRSRDGLVATSWVWLPILATGPLFTLAHSLTTYEGLFFADRYEVFLPLGLAMTIAIGVDAGFGLSQRAPSTPDRRYWALAAIGAVTLAVAVVSAGSHMVEESRVMRTSDWGAVGRQIETVEGPNDAILVIDTRPFAPVFRFGFMSAPRYYDGDSTVATPRTVIRGDHGALLESEQLHVVLFVPRLASGVEPPPGWTITNHTGMIVASSPPLTTIEQRLAELEALTDWLRPDVAVETQIAVAVAARAAGFDEQSEALTEKALKQADAMGLRQYAEELLATGT